MHNISSKYQFKGTLHENLGKFILLKLAADNIDKCQFSSKYLTQKWKIIYELVSCFQAKGEYYPNVIYCFM